MVDLRLPSYPVKPISQLPSGGAQQPGDGLVVSRSGSSGLAGYVPGGSTGQHGVIGFKSWLSAGTYLYVPTAAVLWVKVLLIGGGGGSSPTRITGANEFSAGESGAWGASVYTFASSGSLSGRATLMGATVTVGAGGQAWVSGQSSNGGNSSIKFGTGGNWPFDYPQTPGGAGAQGDGVPSTLGSNIVTEDNTLPTSNNTYNGGSTFNGVIGTGSNSAPIHIYGPGAFVGRVPLVGAGWIGQAQALSAVGSGEGSFLPAIAGSLPGEGARAPFALPNCGSVIPGARGADGAVFIWEFG